MEVSKDKLIKINYKGTLNDGTVFDSSEGREPLEFIFGLGMIIPGLEAGISGLKVGDKKEVKVEAKDAYGPVIEQAVQQVPKSQFPPDMQLEVGMQLAAQGPQGVIPVRVAEIKEDFVTVDFNHPLAGKDLIFNVEIVSVVDATDADMDRILGPVGGGCCGGDCSSGDCEDEGSCGSGGCSHNH